ncbi:MAG: DUF975 family protein [Vagococcus sp.]
MYKTSAQLKQEAKASLQGRWKEAVILNLVPSLIKIITVFFMTLILILPVMIFATFSTDKDSASYEFKSSFVEGFKEGLNESGDDFGDDEFSLSSSSNSAGLAASTSVASKSWMGPVFSFVITFLTIGISFTFLDVIRKGNEQDMRMSHAFRLFNGVDFVPVLLINILMNFFISLWTMLLIVPGIVKYYSYSQSNFIYKDISESKDTKTMGVTSFITESRELMNGHKGRLFWLDLTFIGWQLVGLITFGIGYLFITPYINTTKAAFYDDLAKDRYLALDADMIEEDDEWTNF